MTTSHIQYRGPHSSQGLTVGYITNVSPHVGLDRDRQVIIEFEHGTLRLGDDQAARLVAEIAAARRYTETTRRPNITYPASNCSGALADLESRSNLLQQDELVWRLEQGARRYRTEGRAEKAEGIHWALATIVEMSDAATE